MDYDGAKAWMARDASVTLTEEELNLLPSQTVLQLESSDGFTLRATSQGRGNWKLHRSPVTSADLAGLPVRECLLVPVQEPHN